MTQQETAQLLASLTRQEQFDEVLGHLEKATQSLALDTQGEVTNQARR